MRLHGEGNHWSADVIGRLTSSIEGVVLPVVEGVIDLHVLLVLLPMLLAVVELSALVNPGLAHRGDKRAAEAAALLACRHDQG